MNRYLGTLALAFAALALAACGPGGGETTATTGAEDDAGVTYEVMEMGANEQAALAEMPGTVADYIESSTKGGKTEGVTGNDGYLDVTGVEPVFVGYELVAWTPIEGSEDVEYIELNYLNGHITNSLASPDDALAEDRELEPAQYWNGNTRPVPPSPSAGEQAAVDAMKAEVSARFPDDSPEYGVKRYLFLYEKDGKGIVLGTTLDGELGTYGTPVELSR